MTFLVGVVGFILNEIAGVFSIHFLYAAGISFVSSAVLLVIVSLLTAPEPVEKAQELTWTPALWRAETAELKGKPLWQNYRLQAVVLLLVTAALVITFW